MVSLLVKLRTLNKRLEQMVKKKLTIVNKLGLHARAAAKLVSHASHYASEIKIQRGEKIVNGKSIMGVMMLGAKKGVELEFHVEGDDEHDAIEDLTQLVNDRFGEKE